MSIKYHVNPETMKPGVCKAQPGNCRFKIDKDQHFSNKKEADKFVESQLSQQEKLLVNVEKIHVEKPSLGNYENIDIDPFSQEELRREEQELLQLAEEKNEKGGMMNDLMKYSAVPVYYGDPYSALLGEHMKVVSQEGPENWTELASQESRFLIDDALACDVRKRWNVDSNAPVYLVTEVSYGGHSEYTQENDYSCLLVCDKNLKYFGGVEALNDLIDWLNDGDN